jgi:AraC-like DNA-binding protein
MAEERTVVACTDWNDLLDTCASRPVRIVFVDLFASGMTTFNRMRVLRRTAPRAALIAYVTLTAERARDIFDSGRAGFDSLVLADVTDSTKELRAAIEVAEGRSVAGMLSRQLSDDVPAVVRDAVMIAVTQAHMRLTTGVLAKRAGVSLRVLVRRLAKAGFPPPHQLLTWGRLILAAQMLEEDDRSANSVAEALEFASGSAFRNACQRYLHATPGQLRELGGAPYVARLLLDRSELDAMAPDHDEADDIDDEEPGRASAEITEDDDLPEPSRASYSKPHG